MLSESTSEEMSLKRREICNSLSEAIAFYQASKKPDRESWVCREFLTYLAIPFEESEIIPSPKDPPDILFREARFEIKEILQEKRRRHAEYKEALKKAQEAAIPSPIVSTFPIIELTPHALITLIEKNLDRYKDKYTPECRISLDVLFYVNLQREQFTAAKLLPVQSFISSYGWRSVCVLVGHRSFVLSTIDTTPEFLKSKANSFLF